MSSKLRFRDTINYPITYVDWQNIGVTVCIPPNDLKWKCIQFDKINKPIDQFKLGSEKGVEIPIGWMDFIPNLRGPSTDKMSTGIPRKSKVTATVWLKKIDNLNYDESGSESISASITSATVAGLGYSVGDILEVVSGSVYPALFIVLSTVAGGAINNMSLVQPGYGYSVGVHALSGGTGAGASLTLAVNDLIVINPVEYQWSLLIDDQRFFLTRFDQDDKGIWFEPVEIDLERFENNFVPAIGFYLDLNTNSNNQSGPPLPESLFYTPQWFLTLPRCSDIFINYIVEYLPDGPEDGDIQDVPITMNALHGMLDKRDRRRDKKKGREVTPVKTVLKRGGRDLRKRRETNRAMQNAC